MTPSAVAIAQDRVVVRRLSGGLLGPRSPGETVLQGQRRDDHVGIDVGAAAVGSIEADDHASLGVIHPDRAARAQTWHWDS